MVIFFNIIIVMNLESIFMIMKIKSVLHYLIIHFNFYVRKTQNFFEINLGQKCPYYYKS